MRALKPVAPCPQLCLRPRDLQSWHESVGYIQRVLTEATHILPVGGCKSAAFARALLVSLASQSVDIYMRARMQRPP